MEENKVEIVTSKAAMQKKARDAQLSGKTIGFVPTMGYLHEGHLSLVERARSENDIVIMSIFVNPLQFGPTEDFEAYPRDPERDSHLAEQAGVDFLFIPTAREMYKDGLSTELKAAKRTSVLCGKSRPGHFDGVITVLSKLFNITLPNRAYFGLKDAQQTAVVDILIKDLDFPIELVGVETKREQDGLAKSSRNVYLSEEERNEAAMIYKSLKEAKEMILEGERNSSVLSEKIKTTIQNHTSGIIDYIEILSYPELAPLQRLQGKIIIAAAVKFSKARLIDNIIVEIHD